MFITFAHVALYAAYNGQLIDARAELFDDSFNAAADKANNICKSLLARLLSAVGARGCGRTTTTRRRKAKC